MVVLIDATKLIDGLYIGSRPPTGTALASSGYDILVLCAEEYQPRSVNFPGLSAVIHAPLDDAVPSNQEIDTAITAAMEIADLHARGKNVLVTCMMGRNRSGLVSAIALHFITGYPASDCARYVQRTRVDLSGAHALQNPAFLDLIRTLSAAV